MMLHIEGSKHRWSEGDRYYDLIVILDDATHQPHAFDKGKATILPWIERRRIDLIDVI